MKKLFFLFFCHSIFAVPADISFFVADLKYNNEQGAKICEVQQGSVSYFKGFDFIFQRKGVIGEKLTAVLSQYGRTFWFVDDTIPFAPLKEQLIAHDWRHASDFVDLIKDREFLQIARPAIEDPYDIHSYRAILFARFFTSAGAKEFKRHFPGVLLMDGANAGYFFDKYKMSCLFLGDPVLERVKPKWNLYAKKYTPQLAGEIIRDIGSDLLVIKPRRSNEGKGVIILPKEQLDETLKTLFEKSHTLTDHPDRGYKYWARDFSKSFLVEEYIPSDPISPPHLGGRRFNATMRIVFVLAHSQDQIDLHYLGAYWIIPEKSIDEVGSCNELSKAYVLGTTYYCDVEKETLAIVEEQLREPLKRMYLKMLSTTPY